MSQQPISADRTAPRTGSLVDLLRRQAENWPDDLAFAFLAEDGRRQEWTYADLDRRARAIGAKLAERVPPGERALLVFPAGIDFIASFFGCLYSGVVAVPATYPKPRRPLARMSRIAEDSGAAVALTTGQTLRAIDFDQQDAAARQMDWLAADEVAPDDEWAPSTPAASDTAFLQYTSGSTSEPKGVIVSHGNLLSNLEAIRVSFGLPEHTGAGSAQTGVFWLPAYHDMGLIGGVLTPLYVGGPSVLMPPTTFLKRPMTWLETIHEHRATISGAPNFAYELCIERTTAEQRAELDLSSWRLAFCGAEPINAATLRGFADAFEPAGFTAKSFYPCYGLAESTLLAAGPSSEDPPTLLEVDRATLQQNKVRLVDGEQAAAELVGCGDAPAGHRVEIVCTKTGDRCGDGTVGEIYVQGPSVASGYWNLPDESAAAFGQTVEGVEGPFFRTGDLGFRYRGELYVTGRVKDVVILRGRNHYPQDLEQTAQNSHPAVMQGAAFAVPGDPDGDGEEQLVLVHQVDRACAKEERPAVAEAIRHAVLAEHELDPLAVVLIRQTSLPVTSSGKAQRSRCREQFLAGELRTLYEWRRQPSARRSEDLPPVPDLAGMTVADAAERIVGWMEAWLTSRSDIDLAGLDPQKPFAELGLDSLTSVELSGDLEQAFGVPLPPTVAWNYPTPIALAGYLAEQTLGIKADAPAADADLAAMLDDIEQLSDEEAARLLEEG